MSVAVDWIADNLYLADMLGQRIHVLTMNERSVDGKMRRLQATILDNIDGSPKDIAVDPSEG